VEVVGTRKRNSILDKGLPPDRKKRLQYLTGFHLFAFLFWLQVCFLEGAIAKVVVAAHLALGVGLPRPLAIRRISTVCLNALVEGLELHSAWAHGLLRGLHWGLRLLVLLRWWGLGLRSVVVAEHGVGDGVAGNGASCGSGHGTHESWATTTHHWAANGSHHSHVMHGLLLGCGRRCRSLRSGGRCSTRG
jgi:hypothetical protein